jgi:hypothetical protein
MREDRTPRLVVVVASSTRKYEDMTTSSSMTCRVVRVAYRVMLTRTHRRDDCSTRYASRLESTTPRPLMAEAAMETSVGGGNGRGEATGG